MTPEVKTEWLIALRSGKYKQTKQLLERRDGKIIVGNCCLGVLLRCQNIRPKIRDNHATFGVHECHGPEERILTSYYRDKFGIRSASVEILWWMNDNEEKSFSQIADWIERNL